jgi:hypothetical protein
MNSVGPDDAVKSSRTASHPPPSLRMMTAGKRAEQKI